MLPVMHLHFLPVMLANKPINFGLKKFLLVRDTTFMKSNPSVVEPSSAEALKSLLPQLFIVTSRNIVMLK